MKETLEDRLRRDPHIITIEPSEELNIPTQL